jgi:hypothetical protein
MVTSRRRLSMVLAVLMLTVVPQLRAQEQADPVTLFPQSVLDRIADEVSGSLAMRHVYELGAYEGKRYEAEYADTYFETAYVERMAREYGLANVHVDRFPANPQWHARRGELWLMTPDRRLLISHRDVPASLVPGSASADVNAKLIYVGLGTSDADYAGKDLRGQIALTTGPIGPVVAEAVTRRGAVGIVTTYNGLGKPIDLPDLVSWTGVRQPEGGPAIFAFALSHRIGEEILPLAKRGPLDVHAVVETEVFPNVEHEVTVATIPGDGSTDEEVILIAHLFEGITKQGAGDNIAGSATILEVARAYKRLIDQGILPQPKRTVRFLWVPEFVGSIPWVEKHADLVPRIFAAFNMDMVGAKLDVHKGNLHLYRTPASLPTFVPDVAQQFMEYVGETNREKVHNRGIAYAFTRPIVDPSGTRDPFYYHVEKFYGSSDHLVFGQAGVPFVFFNHWPDAVYHTSLDRPFALDATQIKRTAFIGVATTAVLAGADADDAARLASITAGYAGQRVGAEGRDAALMLAAATRDELDEAYLEARNIIEQAYIREHAAIASVERVAKGNREVQRIARAAADGFNRGRDLDLARVDLAYQQISGVSRLAKAAPTAAEQRAARAFPTLISTGVLRPSRVQSAELRGFHAMEALWFADGTRSILEIRNAISAELGAVPLEKVLRFFDEQEERGTVQVRRR